MCKKPINVERKCHTGYYKFKHTECFEKNCTGIQFLTVLKILKDPGTPREGRIHCLIPVIV